MDFLKEYFIFYDFSGPNPFLLYVYISNLKYNALPNLSSGCQVMYCVSYNSKNLFKKLIT